MRIAIISDIHGNLEAFETVLADIEKQQIHQTISLGDNIGYGADAEAVMQLLIAQNISSVLGNHEWACINKKVYRWYKREVKESLNITMASLSDSTIDHLKKMPMNLNTRKAYYVHGFPPDSTRHYLHQISNDQITKTMLALPCRVCFIGHTHKLKLVCLKEKSLQISPIDYERIQLNQEDRFIVNVGSVGQSRDGDYRAKYIIFDTTENRLMVRKLNYDCKTAAQKIVDVGMPVRFAQAVYSDIGK